jgi:hypothetical protein
MPGMAVFEPLLVNQPPADALTLEDAAGCLAPQYSNMWVIKLDKPLVAPTILTAMGH